MPNQVDELRAFLLENIPDHPRDIVRLTADAFDVTPQTVSYHLRKLQKEGTVTAHGRTSARRYFLKEAQSVETYALDGKLEEHIVWRDFVSPTLEGIPNRAREICHYGITEMINNAVDHSQGSCVRVEVGRTSTEVNLTVSDDGIGIFKKLHEALELPGPRDAVLELTKGKLTTDPQRHTGEGIFFTSRMFDEFALTADELALIHLGESGDWFIEGSPARTGTTVRMVIDPSTTRTTNLVFDRFTSPDHDGMAFDVTHVPVALAAHGEDNLISRSQARRVSARCNLFRRIVLDFHGVNQIGRAFADELFRVFPREHPEVTLTYVRASPEVERTILGAIPRGRES